MVTHISDGLGRWASIVLSPMLQISLNGRTRRKEEGRGRESEPVAARLQPLDASGKRAPCLKKKKNHGGVSKHCGVVLEKKRRCRGGPKARPLPRLGIRKEKKKRCGITPG